MDAQAVINQIRFESSPEFVARKKYENALSWVEFYKRNRRKITISRREVARLKADRDLAKPLIR